MNSDMLGLALSLRRQPFFLAVQNGQAIGF